MLTRSDEEFGLGSAQAQMAPGAEFKTTFYFKCWTTSAVMFDRHWVGYHSHLKSRFALFSLLVLAVSGSEKSTRTTIVANNHSSVGYCLIVYDVTSSSLNLSQSDV